MRPPSPEPGEVAMVMFNKYCRRGLALLLALVLLAGCASAAAPELAGLEYESSMERTYATEFSVDYYSGGYKLLSIGDGSRYLVVPEGAEAPAGLDPSIVVLRQPLDSIYLVAAAAMSLFDALDALDAIRLSGTQESGWYIENARRAMEEGRMLFAGKYSEPDYEMMISEGCDLAIESTMILHSPKVKEMIEMLGIPVFIEYSSYESHPLGRTEWIKLYGAMLNREEQAAAFFDEQAAIIDELRGFENTGKTVAYFYLSSDGSVVVRSSTDYVAKMIEIAGGKYIFDEIGDPESRRSSVSLTMEEFYAAAVDADYIIYNANVDDTMSDLDGLLGKSALFSDFKAVREGNVWCTGKYLYQATDIVGKLITDIHRMLLGEEGDMTFLYRLE